MFFHKGLFFILIIKIIILPPKFIIIRVRYISKRDG